MWRAIDDNGGFGEARGKCRNEWKTIWVELFGQASRGGQRTVSVAAVKSRDLVAQRTAPSYLVLHGIMLQPPGTLLHIPASQVFVTVSWL